MKLEKGGGIILMALLVLLLLPIGYINIKGFTEVNKRAQQLSEQSTTQAPETKTVDVPNKEEIKFLLIIYALLAAIVWGMSAIWVYRDAQDRGKSGFIVMLFTLLCAWPLSLLFWVVVRPKSVSSIKT